MENHLRTTRAKRITVLAYGEGEDEKIFIRYIASLYRRTDKVSVSSSCAGGTTPMQILEKAIQFRGGEKRDFEFILLDCDVPWPKEMEELAEREGIELIGNKPCLEDMFLEILKSSESRENLGSGRCKEMFEQHCAERNFNQTECVRLFPKALLNEARTRIEKLDRIIKIMEGDLPADNND